MFEKAKGLNICKTIIKFFFEAWGFLLIEEKMYLVSHCHVKKIYKICHIFFNKYFFFIIYFFIVIVFS